MAYTTAQIDAVVATLEGSLGQGVAEVNFDGHHLKYSTAAEIRQKIAYFNSLRAEASDAPATPKPRVRTFLMYGGNGIGVGG
jgi:hypothetical protein